MRAKRLVTIVLHIENLELRKDTGQIPYQFYNVLGYNSTLVTYYYTLKGGRKAGPVSIPPTLPEQIKVDYPFIDTEVKGLNLVFLENKGRGKFYEIAVYEYLKKEAKNIDVLNFFHFNSETVFYTLLFKFLNPQGKVYVKLDIDIDYYKYSKSIFNLNGKFGLAKSIFYSSIILPLFFKSVSLISAESEAGLSYFGNRYKASISKLILIPNGVDSTRINNLMGKRKGINEKENIVLTTGRIGVVQKNHELLLKVIPTIANEGWKFYFTGPIEDDFQPLISEFYKSYPDLTEVVIFTGAIKDPSVLYDYYDRSKIFCLPSRWEGFPLAAVEAAYFGNVLVLSDGIYAADTLTNKSVRTFESENESSLTDLISIYMNDQSRLADAHKSIKKYAEENFTWTSIIRKIDSRLKCHQ